MADGEPSHLRMRMAASLPAAWPTRDQRGLAPTNRRHQSPDCSPRRLAMAPCGPGPIRRLPAALPYQAPKVPRRYLIGTSPGRRVRPSAPVRKRPPVPGNATRWLMISAKSADRVHGRTRRGPRLDRIELPQPACTQPTRAASKRPRGPARRSGKQAANRQVRGSLPGWRQVVPAGEVRTRL